MDSTDNKRLVLYFSIFLCLANAVVGFNDDLSTDKWSPKFLYENVYSIPKTVPRPSSAIIPPLPVVYQSQEPERLMNRRLSFYGFPGSGISSDWAPSQFANRFQLKKKDTYAKRASCVGMGHECLFQSRFYGAMKLDCCAGTTCEKIKGNFICVSEDDHILEDDSDELPIEEVYEDEMMKK